MIRPWPRSLAWQLITLLLIGLILAQGIGVLMFADERRQALLAGSREHVLARTANVARLLQSMPRAMHGRVVEISSTRRIRFWTAGNAAVDRQALSDVDRGLARRLDSHLGDFVGARALVDLRRESGFLTWRHGGSPVQGTYRRAFDRPPGAATTGGSGNGRGRDIGPVHHYGSLLSLVMAVPLDDGTWLNAQTLVAPPLPGWAFPTLAGLGLAAAATCVVVILVVRRSTRPLRRLADAAEAFGRGEHPSELAEAGPIEVRRTTRAFNEMQGRIRRFVEDRMRMLAAISHDLRTPITSLRLRVELVEDAALRERMRASLAELEHMTEATLAFSREDAAEEATRTVDLVALVDSVAGDVVDQGGEASVQGPERLPYTCRPVAMTRAFRNVVDNAVSYGERARIALSETGQGVVLTVDDDGPGIPVAQRDEVFEPFVRLEESRSRDTGGTGLGLAIARTIVRRHGGDITLANRPDGGLRVTITLP